MSEIAEIGQVPVNPYPESSKPTELDGWVSVTPRASVRWFAEQIEIALRRNDHKGGWHNDKPLNLSARVQVEAGELDVALLQSFSPGEVIGEAADVGAMAMMVSEHYRKGGPSLDQGHTLPAPPETKE